MLMRIKIKYLRFVYLEFMNGFDIDDIMIRGF